MAKGVRRLRSVALGLIAAGNAADGAALAKAQYDAATTMTERQGALAVLASLDAPERAAAMERLEGSLHTIYDWLNDVFTAWGAVARDGAALGPVSPRTEPPDPDDPLFGEESFADAVDPGPRA